MLFSNKFWKSYGTLLQLGIVSKITLKSPCNHLVLVGILVSTPEVVFAKWTWLFQNMFYNIKKGRFLRKSCGLLLNRRKNLRILRENINFAAFFGSKTRKMIRKTLKIVQKPKRNRQNIVGSKRLPVA